MEKNAVRWLTHTGREVPPSGLLRVWWGRNPVAYAHRQRSAALRAKAKQPNSQTAKQPNSQTAKQPNSQTAKQPYARAAPSAPPLAPPAKAPVEKGAKRLVG
jgi:hypothetical protein